MAQFRMGPSGGAGGEDFSNQCGKVTKVTIRSGGQIDAITLSGDEGTVGPFGGTGGDETSWKVSGGLVRITGTAHDRVVHQIQFYDGKGRISPLFGKNKGRDSFLFECPPKYHITGIFGGYGKRLDAIGVIIESISKGIE